MIIVKKIKNKKGFLLGEETLKIIMALIALAFLVYFLGSLYFNHIKNQEKEEAKATLEFLLKEINRGAEKIDIFNPDGWLIVSFSNGKDKPESCEGKNCICICEDRGCDVGVCKESEKEIGIYEDEGHHNSYFINENYLVEKSIKIEEPPVRLYTIYKEGIIKLYITESEVGGILEGTGENAQSFLNDLIKQMGSMESQETRSIQIPDELKGKQLLSWYNGKTNHRPTSCNEWENCICIHKDGDNTWADGGFSCIDASYKVTTQDPISMKLGEYNTNTYIEKTDSQINIKYQANEH